MKRCCVFKEIISESPTIRKSNGENIFTLRENVSSFLQIIQISVHKFHALALFLNNLKEIKDRRCNYCAQP